MNTATATATEPERAFTAREGLDAICAAIAAIEQYQMTLEPPRVCGQCAAFCLWKGKHEFEFGGSPVEAARNLAAAIGGVDRPHESHKPPGARRSAESRAWTENTENSRRC